MGGPADAIISLTTYSQNADPLLLVSLRPTIVPTIKANDGSSLEQWREDTLGDHYAIVEGVGPNGGILGLYNMMHFAAEELNSVLRLQCSFILAFDALFWDHLRGSSNICPLGIHDGDASAAAFCSGRGRCEKHGICQCDADYGGAACEHDVSDMVVVAKGRYHFEVAPGHYQYFRIRVPPHYPGGYLKLEANSNIPIVILIGDEGLPTKSHFQLSNFDAWVSGLNLSVLKYKVTPSVGAAFASTANGAAPPAPSRRLPNLTAPSSRRLAATRLPELDDGTQAASCPATLPTLQDPLCDDELERCETGCMGCVQCVPSRATPGCEASCDVCASPKCAQALSHCAGTLNCHGPEWVQCDDKCGGCLACLNSNDKQCGDCGCCATCLPLAGKCGRLRRETAEDNRFVFVGVFNHERHSGGRHALAEARLRLVSDANFDESSVTPLSWVSSLYDPFHDLQSVDASQRQDYPAGEQFLYEVQFPGEAEGLRNLDVRLYRDRLTLLHISSAVASGSLELKFLRGPNVTHVLSSFKVSPKTLFDFNHVHVPNGRVLIHTEGEHSIWCALFGASDGVLHIVARSYGVETPGVAASSFRFTGLLILALLCCCGGVVISFGRRESIAANLFDADPSVPISERLLRIVNAGGSHESTVSLTRHRSTSFGGYVGSDILDRRVEDQYLNRGGFGDDGI